MLAVTEYHRPRAYTYAKRWAFARNPLFNDYTPFGGDCTNFISQCLLAGSLQMNTTPTFGWYYQSDQNRSPSWTGVPFFYDFLVGNMGVGPFGRETDAAALLVGDAVQLGRDENDFYHTLLVVGREGEDLLVAAHSDDAFARPLSTYVYNLARFLHIEGVRVELADAYADYARLLDGIALPPSGSYRRVAESNVSLPSGDTNREE